MCCVDCIERRREGLESEADMVGTDPPEAYPGCGVMVTVAGSLRHTGLAGLDRPTMRDEMGVCPRCFAGRLKGWRCG